MMISKLDNASRGQMYALLSRLYRAEVDGELLDALKALALPQAEGALAEGYALLKNYLDSCGENALEELAVDYANLFLAAGSADGAAAIPCESVYTSPKRIFMQDAWEDVSRRYAGKGLGRDGAVNDLHEDHLALELEFMTWLVEHGSPEEQADFLNTHLLDWVPAFAADIEKYARWDFYKAVGRITAAFLALEGEFLSTLVSGGARQSRSFSVRADRMAPIFTRLKEKYRIFAPKRFPGRGPKGGDLIRYGRIDAITDVVYNEKAHFSAKEVFYPVSQTMLYFNGDHCTEKELEDDKGILLFVRPCDINAIRRLDQIFLHNGQPDLYYARMREKVKLILLECREGFENCFCVSMGSNVAWDYAAAVRIDDICALTEICDEELLPYFQDEVPIEFAPEFVEENRRAARPPRIGSGWARCASWTTGTSLMTGASPAAGAIRYAPPAPASTRWISSTTKPAGTANAAGCGPAVCSGTLPRPPGAAWPARPRGPICASRCCTKCTTTKPGSAWSICAWAAGGALTAAPRELTIWTR